MKVAPATSFHVVIVWSCVQLIQATFSTSDSSTEPWSKQKYYTSKSKVIDAKKHLLRYQSSDESGTNAGLEIPSLISPDARRIDIYKKNKFDSKKTADYVRRFSAADKNSHTNRLEPRGYDLGIPIRRPLFRQRPQLSNSKTDNLHLNRFKTPANTPPYRTTKKLLNKITLYVFPTFDNNNKKETSKTLKHNAILSRRISPKEKFSETRGRNENTDNTELRSGHRPKLPKNEIEYLMTLQSLNIKKQLSQTETSEEIPNRKSYAKNNKKFEVVSSLDKRDIEKIEVISSAEWKSVETEKAEVISSVETHEIETTKATQLEKNAKLNSKMKMSKNGKFQNPKRDLPADNGRLSEAKKVKPTLRPESDMSDTERFEAITVNAQLKQKQEVSPSQRLIVTVTNKKLKRNRDLQTLKGKEEIPASSFDSQESENESLQAKPRFKEPKRKNLIKPQYGVSASENKIYTDASFKVFVLKPEKVKSDLTGDSLNQKKDNFRVMQNRELYNKKYKALNAKPSRKVAIKFTTTPKLHVSQIVKFNTKPNDETPALQTEKLHSDASWKQENLKIENPESRLLKPKKFELMPHLKSHLPEKEKVKLTLTNELRVSEIDKPTTVTNNTISAPHTYKYNTDAKVGLNVTKRANHYLRAPETANVMALSNHVSYKQKSKILVTKSNGELRTPKKELVNIMLNNEVREEDSGLFDSELSSESHISEKETLKIMSTPKLEGQENKMLHAKPNNEFHALKNLRIKLVSNNDLHVSKMAKFNTTPDDKIRSSQNKIFYSLTSNKQENLETRHRVLHLPVTKKFKVMTYLESQPPKKEKVKPVLNNDLRVSETVKFTTMRSNPSSTPHKFNADAKLQLNVTKIWNRDVRVPETENVKATSNYILLRDQKSKILDTKLRVPEQEKLNAILTNDLRKKDSDLFNSESSRELPMPEKEKVKIMVIPELQEQGNIIIHTKSNHELHELEKQKVKNISNNNLHVSRIVKFNKKPNDETPALRIEKLNLDASWKQENLKIRNPELRLTKTKTFKLMPYLESHIPEKEKGKPILTNELRVSETEKLTTMTRYTISMPQIYKYNADPQLELNVTKTANHDARVHETAGVKALSNHVLLEQTSKILVTKLNGELRTPKNEQVSAMLKNKLRKGDSDIVETKLNSKLRMPEKETLKVMSTPNLREQENKRRKAKSNQDLRVPEEQKAKNISNKDLDMIELDNYYAEVSNEI